MGKGQRRGRGGTVSGLTNKKCDSMTERSPTKRKTPKKEFQGKLSHASPNTRITRYYQPQVLADSGPKPLTPINIKAALRNCRNTSVKVMQEANNGGASCNGGINHQLVKEQNLFLRPDCNELPMLSHRKPVSPLRIAHSKLPFQSNKKTIKSRRRLNGITHAANHQTPPLSESKTCNNHKLTEYFPVRRSARRTKKVVLEEKQRHIEEAVLSKCEDGLQVQIFEGKGRGIVATRDFYKGEFVVEYAGELISLEEAKKREQMYAHDQNTGCYMYYFKHKNVHYCVDATSESDRFGRLVNHSRFGNLVTKTVVVNDQPHLVLIAKEDIRPGEEVTYDYGDRSKESLYYHPWLAT